MEDLEEWEVLPEDGFLEIHDDGGKKIFSRKYTTSPEHVFKDYFTPKSSKFVETTEKARVPNQLVPVPIQFEPAVQKLQDEVLKEVKQAPTEINLRPSTVPEIIKIPRIVPGKADQDLASQVFFKKMTEPEFDDMKMNSPRSINNSRGIKPQTGTGVFQFEEKPEAYKAGEAMEAHEVSSPRQKVDHEDSTVKKNKNMNPADIKKEVNWEENSGGLNILKWSLTGIGAICSFGVATVCIFVFGGLQKSKQRQQNQKLQFHVCTEGKRSKQVAPHATKLNEAISTARGVPISGAHIKVGGYYDGLWSLDLPI